MKRTQDIVDIAVAAGGFKTFVAAVKTTGLVETLKGSGPLTIFAPDDRAFSLLPSGTLDELMKDIPKLKAILMYHIISGKFTIDEVAQMKTAKTLQGQEIKIHGTGWWHLHMNPVINDDAHIVSTDILTENSIIHVVDRVLMPSLEISGEYLPAVERPPEVMPIVPSNPEMLPTTEVITEQTPEIAKVTGVFEVFNDSICRFRFHLKAGNGQIIAVSQSYGTKEAALTGIASIKKNAPIATIADSTTKEIIPDTAHRGIVQDPDFEIHSDSAGKFRFHLKAANGEIIAVSQAYLSRDSAQNGIASIKKNAPMAKIIDQTIAMT